MKLDSKYTGIIFHILGWAIYFSFQMVFSGYFDKSISMTEDVVWWIIQVGIIVFFYLNYLLLIPRLLFRKRYILYALAVIAIGAAIVIGIEFFIGSTRPGPEHGLPPPEMMNHDMPHHDGPHGRPDGKGILNGITVFFIVLLVSSAIRITGELLRVQRQKQRLENEKLSAELIALKAQINPHFVFNVLNNICSLARKKSEDTETFIIKLSQLIRYNLYDDKGGKMSLDREVSFLTNYIDLQKMRLGDAVFVDYRFTGDFGLYEIEPMMLFPFIENAFKHGVSYSMPSLISISINLEKSCLHMRVTNSIVDSKTPQSEENPSGIGLTNVKKLLALLYAHKHSLSISTDNNVFSVDLKIELA